LDAAKIKAFFARGEKRFDAPAKREKSSHLSVFSLRKNLRALRADLPRSVSRRLRADQKKIGLRHPESLSFLKLEVKGDARN
jgi:hypothetical protein